MGVPYHDGDPDGGYENEEKAKYGKPDRFFAQAFSEGCFILFALIQSDTSV